MCAQKVSFNDNLMHVYTTISVMKFAEKQSVDTLKLPYNEPLPPPHSNYKMVISLSVTMAVVDQYIRCKCC